MSIFATLTSLNLPEDTVVNLSYREGTDVFVHNETEVETALSDTDVVTTFADLIATPGLEANTQFGGSVLDNLRDEGLLEDYTRDGTFASYLAETINNNFYDVDLIEVSTEKYDHKRGFTTLTADVQVPLTNFVEVKPFVSGWEVSVKTENGLLVLG
tara:strand:- start:3547 stop:4017 length:471 start_codon:yes stop_codon:yes gene_type:complete